MFICYEVIINLKPPTSCPHPHRLAGGDTHTARSLLLRAHSALTFQASRDRVSGTFSQKDESLLTDLRLEFNPKPLTITYTRNP